MFWLLILVAVVVMLAVVFGSQLAKGGGKLGFPYVPAKRLFSEAERRFLAVLDEAVGADYRVFGKVRLGDVAQVKSGLGRSAAQGALNRIGSKHFDFVVCRSTDLSIACAVELNDRSHAGKRAQARDEIVAGVCQAIGLPLLTVPARSTYTVDDVRASFHQAVAPTPAPEAIGGR
jgi:hypothetical protein